MARILVIEDDDSTREAYRAILAARGHSVITAINGVHGLDRLRLEPVDVLITDLRMSYGGLSTIRLLQQTHPQLGIMAVSGSETHLAAARELGADVTLKKPITAQDLEKAVTETLTRRAPDQNASVPPSSDSTSPV